MKNLLAAYEPDLMVIRIKEDLEALSNRDGIIVPFKDMEEVSVFFHEWIHFIHNTSTLIGLTLFYSYIGLWKIFRYSYANGLAGEVGLNDDLKKQFNNMLKFMGGLGQVVMRND
ncbi:MULTISPECIES: hypothetical protein [Acinetobacter]|uniref:hypothetical protein n=1 Tax=Acinetobacter TaxID=469 RepID=UPI0020C8CE6A|nr:hypothetical protein [Acinetobacter sp. Z1]UTO18846.1 hypothetical protein NGC85_13030 [Acinetobacter sp. Z1]